MRTLTGAILFFVFAFSASAQEVIVIDKDSREPLPNVAIFNIDQSRTSITNLDGKADLSIFSLDEEIIFRLVSHDEKRQNKREILENNNRVYLQRNENQLEQVVLSVAKFEMKKDEVPQKTFSLSQEDIQLSNPQTSADLLESSGKVFVQKSQLGGGSPMIRGFSTNRLLLTVDGVRMNTAIFRSGNLQNIISIDPLSVERTEVILGPGSVVYGSDAVGGVMNFHSLKPKFSFREGTSFSGNAYMRYATANKEKTVHADVNLGRENWAFLTGITYSDFDDLKMGKEGPDEYLRHEYVLRKDGQDVIMSNPEPRLQRPTGYEQINLLQKVKFMPGKGWDFNLGIIYSTTSDFPRYDRLYRKQNDALRYAEWYYGPQSWFMGNFKINKNGGGDLYNKAQFTAAYQNFKESRHNRDFGESIRYNTRENVDAWSANLDFEKDFKGSKLFYGLEYVLNTVHSLGKTNNIQTGGVNTDASRYPDGSQWQSLAAYASYQWKITPDLAFQSGARYNHILINANFEESFYNLPFDSADLNTGALTGSVGLNWDQNRYFNWKLNFSTAFRAPNIDDVGKVFDSEPGAVVVPNPDLKPEYAYNAELGTDVNISDNLRLDVAAFYTYLDNAMLRRDFSLDGETEIEYQGEMSRVQAIQNASEAYIYGFEGGLEMDISVALQFSSQISVTQGEEKQEDGTTAALRHAAPVFGNTHLVWHKKRLKLDLFGEYNGQFDFEDLAPSEQGKPHLYAIHEQGNPYSPSWYTINLTSQYEISDSWLATASLENITNQLYRTYSSGIAAAGRNFILALRYSF